MVSYFPLISATISFVFLILLVFQYVKRRKKHQLMWTVAVALFALSSLLAFISETSGWTVPAYQLYYFTLSPMVAFMGMGTLYLLQDKPWGKYFLIYTLTMSAIFLILILTSTIDTTLLSTYSPPSEIGSAAIASTPKLLSPLLSVPGGLLIIGGALYSFWLDRSRKYTLLIALGGIIHLLSGLRARFGGDPTYFFALTTAGVLLLFIGFLLSSEYIRKKKNDEHASAEA
jgi:hypothetical protein